MKSDVYILIQKYIVILYPNADKCNGHDSIYLFDILVITAERLPILMRR